VGDTVIDLTALLPEFESAVEALLAQLKVEVGIDYRPYLGYRTFAEQQTLYAKYQAGGPRAAPPWESPHQWGLAVDVCAYHPGPDWSDGAYAALQSALVDSSVLAGLGAKDLDHIELRHPSGAWGAEQLAALPRVMQSELSTRAWPLVRTICSL